MASFSEDSPYRPPLPAWAHPLETLKIIELKSKLVVAATDRLSRRRWRILAIDREPRRQLAVEEDPREYTEEECRAEVGRLIAQGGGTLRKPLTAHGLLGCVCLVESYHLAVVERKRSVGWLMGHEIFAAEHVTFIQVYYPSKMSEDAKKVESKYLRYLSDSHLTSPCFFSYSYDLTRTFQSNMGGRPVAPTADCPTAPPDAASGSDMYCWNHHLLHGSGFYRQLRNKQWAVQLISGYFEQAYILENTLLSIFI